MMNDIPYTYSLGPIIIFDDLARIARKNGDWRRVARLIQKMNLILNRTIKLSGDAERFFKKSRIYLDLALKNTKLKDETINAIRSIYL